MPARLSLLPRNRDDLKVMRTEVLRDGFRDADTPAIKCYELSLGADLGLVTRRQISPSFEAPLRLAQQICRLWQHSLVLTRAASSLITARRIRRAPRSQRSRS